MANDLVRWGRYDADGYLERHETDPQDDSEQWDLPPAHPRPRTDRFSAFQQLQDGRAARIADEEAADARRRGDKALAFSREGDAEELRLNPWDWGDLRTWLIIVGMCVGFLIFSAFVYFMPQGRHNQIDGSEPTPTIRVLLTPT